MINILDMPHTTVEQVVRFRAEAISQIESLKAQVMNCRAAMVYAINPLRETDMLSQGLVAHAEIKNGLKVIDDALALMAKRTK